MVFCHTVEGRGSIVIMHLYYVCVSVLSQEGGSVLMYVHQCYATECRGDERRKKFTVKLAMSFKSLTINVSVVF